MSSLRLQTQPARERGEEDRCRVNRRFDLDPGGAARVHSPWRERLIGRWHQVRGSGRGGSPHKEYRGTWISAPRMG